MRPKLEPKTGFKFKQGQEITFRNFPKEFEPSKNSLDLNYRKIKKIEYLYYNYNRYSYIIKVYLSKNNWFISAIPEPEFEREAIPVNEATKVLFL